MIGINALELGLAVLIVPDASFNQQIVTTTLSAPRAAPNVNLLDRTRTCNSYLHFGHGQFDELGGGIIWVVEWVGFQI